MIEHLNRALEPLKTRLKLMLGRAVIALVDDSGAVQEAQLKRLAGETADGVEVFGWYGFAAHPHPGAAAIVASLGGVRSHGVVIAIADRRYRLKVEAGEVAIHDDQGQAVHLKRDGIYITGQKLVVEADEASFSGNITVAGNTKVEGDFEVVGDSKLGAGAVQFVKLANDMPATKVKAK